MRSNAVGGHIRAADIVVLLLTNLLLFNQTSSSSAAPTSQSTQVEHNRKTGKTAESDPASWRTYFKAGEADLAAQAPEPAERHFRKALDLVSKQSKSEADIEECTLKLADTLSLRNETSEAQRLLQSVLELRTKRYGSNAVQLAPILFSLGSIQESEGNHTAAMSYYQRALRINEKNYGPYSPALAENLGRMGRVSAKIGDHEQSAKHYKRAISILLQDPNLSSSSQLKGLMHDYSDLLRGSDNSNKDLISDFQADIMTNPQDAGDEASKTKSSQNAPSYSPHTAGAEASKTREPQNTSLNSPNLPRIDSLDNTSEAPIAATISKSDTSAFDKQSRIQREASGNAQINADPAVALRGFSRPESDETLSPAYKIINDALFKQNRYGRGIDYYQRMIAADINALGPNHPSVANDLTGLAQLYIAQEKYADAEPLLMRSLPIYQKVYGSSNVLTINATASLASVEFHLGKIEKATDLYHKALNNGQLTLGPNSLETARILNELAYLSYKQGKLQEACTFYQWAVASTEGAVGIKDPLLAACLKDYAQVLRSLGLISQAGLAENRAQRILTDASH